MVDHGAVCSHGGAHSAGWTFRTGLLQDKQQLIHKLDCGLQVPFRLTRMMVKAMEVSGVEGTFRKTCELVMRVLRMEKDRLMAVLEAFIYDPLINWRLALNRVEAVGAGGMGLGATNEEAQDLDFGMAARNDLRDRDNQPGTWATASHPTPGIVVKSCGIELVVMCQGMPMKSSTSGRWR